MFKKKNQDKKKEESFEITQERIDVVKKALENFGMQV